MNMNRRVAVSVLLAIFVLVSLASPAVAQAPSDAVLLLHFDEGSGTTAKDSSGNGNDGTIYGATWTTGVSGKALQFDGVDDYVDCENDASLDFGTGTFTIETWVKTIDATTASWKGIVGRWDGSNGYWLQYFPSTGAWAFGWHGSTFLNPTKSISDGNWHHVVGKRTGLTSAELYIDGAFIGSRTDLPSTSSDTTDHLSMGRLSSGLGRYFKGTIDEVAIYSKALTPEEIKAHYLARRVGGSTKESTSDLINLVSTRIDTLKRDNIDTSLIEQSLENAQDAYDSGNHDEAYELAQNAQKMADNAYEAQQYIESAQSEIEDAKSIGAEVKEAEAKLKEAKEALDKGNYEYACNWAADASEQAKHASVGSVQIKDLKALATKYDERTVVISGTIRDIETVYGEGYTFALDDGSGMISVVYQGSLGDIKDGDRVTVSGVFQASTGTVVADNVEKSGVGGSVPGFEAIFAIAGLLAVVYLLRRRK